MSEFAVACSVAKDAAYSSAFSVGVVPTIAAHDISLEGLTQFVCGQAPLAKGTKLWKYMGTKAGMDYLITFPFLDAREMYRIKTGVLQLGQKFDLTANEQEWATIIYLDEFGDHKNNVAPPQIECSTHKWVWSVEQNGRIGLDQVEDPFVGLRTLADPVFMAPSK